MYLSPSCVFSIQQYYVKTSGCVCILNLCFFQRKTKTAIHKICVHKKGENVNDSIYMASHLHAEFIPTYANIRAYL